MKNIKISLLAAGATIALLACSSLEVSNPEVENFPDDWSLSEFASVNPDLLALQIKDQVNIINTVSKLPSDEENFMADADVLKQLAITYAGFTEKSYDLTDTKKLAYLKAFNINGVANEAAVFDSLVKGHTVCAGILNGKGVALDSSVLARQYVVYGAVEGRPYRKCKDAETDLVKRGECQSADEPSIGFSGHLYCDKDGEVFCVDCDTGVDNCPDAVKPASSSSAAPKSSAGAKSSSSEAAGEGDSSSSEAAGEGDSSSSEGAEPESSEATADSSSSEAAGEESSSSVTE